MFYRYVTGVYLPELMGGLNLCILIYSYFIQNLGYLFLSGLIIKDMVYN